MKSIYGKLSGMMFLQYAVWGVWLPVIAQYLGASPEKGGLGFTGGQIGMILGLAGSIGAVTSPFIGQIADRKFSAERCLGVLMIIGGALKWITAYQTEYTAWLFLSVAYSIIYMPSISLSNSVAFANIKNPDSEFPYIRVWGTIGWIAASWIFPWFFLLEKNIHVTYLPPFIVGDQYADATARLVNALKVSGVISFAYGIYCFMLPHTPPKAEVKELALSKSLGLFSKPSFLLLVLASLPISMIHQIYFMKTAPFIVHIGFEESLIGPVMSIGQFFEIGVMAALGLMLAKMGFRWTIVVGGMAYFVRYAIFGTVDLPKEIIALSQALHGFCFSCFFAAGFIYVDRIAPADIRHSAQTVFGIIILGIGPVAGGAFMGWLEKVCTPDGGELNYSAFWYVLSAIGLVTTVVIAVFFRDETQNRSAALGQDSATEASEVA